MCCRAKSACKRGAPLAVPMVPPRRSISAALARRHRRTHSFSLMGVDFDLLGVDLSTIPRDSIERIEISRGNSGAVLYGGGVINIITKTGVALPPTARVEGGLGSFNQHEINGSAAASSGPFAASVFAYGVNSDGYRVNSGLRERTAIGDLSYTGDEGKA